jgi:hypothetical protein
MAYQPIRIADLEVDRRVVVLFRRVLPLWSILVLVTRRRNERKASKQAKQLGEQVGRVVVQAQDGAKTLRRLTIWLVVLTILNVAFVAYSALK